ncbi:MAG: TMEM165/GDT1 family protein [Nitrososphaerota archaeon]|nr:TMEM165/GDT1 family protein [Nitrososphaerota archaeon]
MSISGRRLLSMDTNALLGGFLTVFGTIFIAELTDKDALLLLSLATKTRPLLVFVGGAIAFTITSAIIVTFGSVLVVYIPIYWIKLAGGTIMLAYAVLEYLRGLQVDARLEDDERRFIKHIGKNELHVLLGIVGSLILLDLAGDTTELLTIVFVAQYGDALLVLAGAVAALVAASALETVLGNRLGRLLSSRNVRYLSVLVFLVIGSVVVVSTVFGLA